MSEERMNVGHHPLVRRGWRSFECADCGHKWSWPSRNYRSPSGENCPECGGWEFPCESHADESLPVDESGNLTCPWNMKPNDQVKS